MSNTQLILSRVLSSTKTKIYYLQAAQICVLWYQLAVQNNIFMLSLAALNIYRMHLYNFFLILYCSGQHKNWNMLFTSSTNLCFLLASSSTKYYFYIVNSSTKYIFYASILLYLYFVLFCNRHFYWDVVKWPLSIKVAL